jgi:RND family efflux transporter MFP subunit
MQSTGSPKYAGHGNSPPRNFAFVAVIIVILVIAGALFVVGFIPRLFNQRELDKASPSTPVVHVVIAKPAGFKEVGILPGNIEAIQYANIYARVDGYLKTRDVDIGSHVQPGQLLAEIETPTVDAELAQAVADYNQSKAQLVSAQSTLKESIAKREAAQAKVVEVKAQRDFADITAKRWKNMADFGSVSLQSRDEKVTNLAAEDANLDDAKADLAAAEANVNTARSQVVVANANVNAKESTVQRFQAEQAFKFVRAPFEGIITERNVDPGALITAGSSSRALELFQLAKIDTLRIYVNAPQTVAHYIESGQRANISVQEFPEREFVGVVSNVAGALDPSTRTRQTEVHIDNRDHTLLPGMYATVQLVVHRTEPWIKISSSSLVPRADGMYVVVADNNKAHYQKIKIGRDFGDSVEVSAGLKDNQQVVVSPPVDLREGEEVEPQPVPSEI